MWNAVAGVMNKNKMDYFLYHGCMGNRGLVCVCGGGGVDRKN